MYNIKQQTVACCMSLRHARSFSAMCSVVSHKPRLFVRMAYVGSYRKERGLRSDNATTFTLYKLWKVFFHSYHVDSVRHDWHKRSL